MQAEHHLGIFSALEPPLYLQVSPLRVCQFEVSRGLMTRRRDTKPKDIARVMFTLINGGQPFGSFHAWLG